MLLNKLHKINNTYSSKADLKRRENLARLIAQAESLMKSGEYRRATDTWSKLIKKHSSILTPGAYLRLAVCYRQLNKNSDANEILSNGLRRFPNYLPALIERAEIASQSEDWKRAEELWLELVNKEDEKLPTGAYVELARARRMQSRYKDAENVIKLLRKERPSSSNEESVLAEYAEISLSAKDYRQALVRWQKLLVEFKNNPYIDNSSKIIKARYYQSVLGRLLETPKYRDCITKYNNNKKKPKIAIFTAIAGNYDTLKLPEVLDTRIDYVLFADDIIDHNNIFKVRPLPYINTDKTREARYIKTHAHTLLNDYDVAVWIDANIMVVDDIYPIIEKFIRSRKSVAAVSHPIRSTIYDEAEVCIEKSKDDKQKIRKQIKRYRRVGYNSSFLIESNLMMFRPQDENTIRFLDTWWNELDKYSRRDQLSLPYALSTNNIDWLPLTVPPNSVRNHPCFVLTPHDLDDYGLLEELSARLANNSLVNTGVVVPNWNGKHDLPKCLDSLLAQTERCEIIVVENGSNDGSLEFLQQNYPDVTILPQTKNLGFAGGVNVGVRYAIKKGFHYIALFNNDANADVNWLKSLVDELNQHTEAGIATCSLINKSSETYDSTGEQYSVWGLPFPRGRGEPVSERYGTQTEIFGATGGASLYRAEMLREIGLFDEDFFAYYEDVDISFRAQLAGWKVRYAPQAVAYHQIGATSSKIKGFTTYQTLKNLPWVLWKNVPFGLLPVILPRFTIAYTSFVLSAVARKQFLPVLRGLFVSLFLLPKKLIQRFGIQRKRKVSTHYIRSIITWDLPPNAKKLRKLRSKFQK